MRVSICQACTKDNLVYYNLVQWPSQDFKGDLDIDYIWVFISSYVNRGVGEPEKPNLSIPSVGQNFSVLKMLRQSHRQKIVQTQHCLVSFKSKLHADSKNDSL